MVFCTQNVAFQRIAWCFFFMRIYPCSITQYFLHTQKIIITDNVRLIAVHKFSFQHLVSDFPCIKRIGKDVMQLLLG